MGDCVFWEAGRQKCDRWWDLDLWLAVLWSLVKLVCESLAVGGGTNSLHEVHPVRVPRWSFCEGEMLKPGLQAALEASSLWWEVKTSIPLSDVSSGDPGTGKTPLCPTAPTNLWVDLEPLGTWPKIPNISLATQQHLQHRWSRIRDFS